MIGSKFVIVSAKIAPKGSDKWRKLTTKVGSKIVQYSGYLDTYDHTKEYHVKNTKGYIQVQSNGDSYLSKIPNGDTHKILWTGHEWRLTRITGTKETTLHHWSRAKHPIEFAVHTT